MDDQRRSLQGENLKSKSAVGMGFLPGTALDDSNQVDIRVWPLFSSQQPVQRSAALTHSLSSCGQAHGYLHSKALMNDSRVHSDRTMVFPSPMHLATDLKTPPQLNRATRILCPLPLLCLWPMGSAAGTSPPDCAFFHVERWHPKCSLVLPVVPRLRGRSQLIISFCPVSAQHILWTSIHGCQFPLSILQWGRHNLCAHRWHPEKYPSPNPNLRICLLLANTLTKEQSSM